ACSRSAMPTAIRAQAIKYVVSGFSRTRGWYGVSGFSRTVCVSVDGTSSVVVGRVEGAETAPPGCRNVFSCSKSVGWCRLTHAREVVERDKSAVAVRLVPRHSGDVARLAGGANLIEVACEGVL